MRRTARLLTGTALAAAAVGLTTAATAAPVYAGDAASTGGLTVYPASVVPGDRAVVTTAVCGEGGSAAGDASAVGAGAFRWRRAPARGRRPAASRCRRARSRGRTRSSRPVGTTSGG